MRQKNLPPKPPAPSTVASSGSLYGRHCYLSNVKWDVYGRGNDDPVLRAKYALAVVGDLFWPGKDAASYAATPPHYLSPEEIDADPEWRHVDRYIREQHPALKLCVAYWDNGTVAATKIPKESAEPAAWWLAFARAAAPMLNEAVGGSQSFARKRGKDVSHGPR